MALNDVEELRKRIRWLAGLHALHARGWREGMANLREKKLDIRYREGYNESRIHAEECEYAARMLYNSVLREPPPTFPEPVLNSITEAVRNAMKGLLGAIPNERKDGLAGYPPVPVDPPRVRRRAQGKPWRRRDVIKDGPK